RCTQIQRLMTRALKIRVQPKNWVRLTASSNQIDASSAVQIGSSIMITAAWLAGVRPWARICKKNRRQVASTTLASSQVQISGDTCCGQVSNRPDNDSDRMPTTVS